jgi:hypothetical protein
MHGKVDLVIDQRLFDLLGEQAFAADFGKEAILHAVTGGADDRDVDHARRGEAGMRRDQTVAHQIGLIERHRAAAGADAQGTKRHADPRDETGRSCNKRRPRRLPIYRQRRRQQ